MIVKENVRLKNARLIFRNFSGAEGTYNPKGVRNFCVLLDPDLANQLYEDGWNVKWLQPRDEYTERQAYIQIAVRFHEDTKQQKFNPKILLISKKGKNLMNETTVSELDLAEIESVDLVFRPYNWDKTGNSKPKAYLKSMAVTIVQDEFDELYYDVPDSAVDAIGGCGQCEACDGTCNHD